MAMISNKKTIGMHECDYSSHFSNFKNPFNLHKLFFFYFFTLRVSKSYNLPKQLMQLQHWVITKVLLMSLHLVPQALFPYTLTNISSTQFHDSRALNIFLFEMAQYTAALRDSSSLTQCQSYPQNHSFQ